MSLYSLYISKCVYCFGLQVFSQNIYKGFRYPGMMDVDNFMVVRNSTDTFSMKWLPMICQLFPHLTHATIQCHKILCNTYNASFGVMMHVLWVTVVTVTNHDIIIITVWSPKMEVLHRSLPTLLLKVSTIYMCTNLWES